MNESSIKGIELLRALALAIRSEQDYGHGSRGNEIIGVELADTDQVSHFVHDVRGIPESFNPRGMSLRDSLNKIVYANPACSSFDVEGERHDLILSGTLRASNWVAVISLPKVVNVLRTHPDAEVSG